MKSIKRFGAFVVGLLLFMFIFNSVSISNYPGNYLLVKQFGAVVKIIDKPGWNWKIPFIQTTQVIPNHKMLYDLEPSSVNTADKKIMNVDSFAIWEVSDPLLYVSSLGANQQNAESRINNAVYNSVKTVLSSTTQEDVISGRDGELAVTITERVGDSLEKYGIKLLKVETKMLDLPDENKASVYQRMISERNTIAAGYTSQGQSEYQKIKNETDKEVNIKKSEAEANAAQLRAEGEAEYMEILSNAYNDASKADFYNFVRSLDALKVTIKGDNKTIILDKDSEIAQMLMGVQ